jgi:hypothetical protein
VIDNFISDTDLPVFLITKDQLHLGISLAKVKDADETIFILVGTSTNKDELKKLPELINLLTQ